MDYTAGYTKARSLADEIRDQAEVSKASGLASRRRPESGDVGEMIEPMSYGVLSVDSLFSDIGDYLDTEESGSALAPKESLRPVARPGSEAEEIIKPVSRGDALENAEIGVRLMEDLQGELGLTKEQAAAFVGNLAHETGGFKFMQEINPTVAGSRGGYGFAQWTGPRRKMFEAWAAENGLDPSSYEANWGYLKKELTEKDSEIQSMGINTLAGLREIEDLEEATRFISDSFLRPGTPHMGSRLIKASGYMEY